MKPIAQPVFACILLSVACVFTQSARAQTGMDKAPVITDGSMTITAGGSRAVLLGTKVTSPYDDINDPNDPYYNGTAPAVYTTLALHISSTSCRAVLPTEDADFA